MDIVKLDNINNICEGLNCYNYKDINFTLTFKKNAKYLVIDFHGLVYPNENIFFAKTKWDIYNINNENLSILCIHDKFLEENRNLITTAYHDTENKKYSDKYITIIEDFIIFLQPIKTIYFGVSIGAISALHHGSKISSKFNSTIICLNGYIYLQNDIYENITKKICDNIIKIDIEKEILNNKNNINEIIIYINKFDHTFFNDNKKFILFCKKYLPEKIKYIIHDDMTINNNGHSSFIPPNMTIESIILSAL